MLKGMPFNVKLSTVRGSDYKIHIHFYMKLHVYNMLRQYNYIYHTIIHTIYKTTTLSTVNAKYIDTNK